MEETLFNQCIDHTLLSIEDAIDEAELDIDYDTIAGILTLEFFDESKIIINRQVAMEQLWVAARSGGFHLNYVENKESVGQQWYCKTDNSSLGQLLDRLFTDQAQTEITLGLEEIHNLT